MKPTTNYGLSDSLIDAVRKSVEEAKLHPNQQKLDVHEPEKDELTSQDFKKLRAGKKVKDGIDTKPKLKEEDEQIDELSNKTYFAAYKAADRKTGSAAIERDGGIKGKHLRTKELAYKGVKRNNAKQMGQQAEDIEQMNEAHTHVVLVSYFGNHTNPVVRGGKVRVTANNHDAAREEALRVMKEMGKKNVKAHSSKSVDSSIEHNFKEEVEQMDEISSELAGRASNARIDRNNSGGVSHTDLKKLRKGTTPLDQQSKTTAGYMKTLDRKNEEYEQMDEIKLADLPRRNVVGKSYGADYVDPEGADETAADMKKAEPKRKSGPQGTMKRRFIKDKSKLRMQYK